MPRHIFQDARRRLITPKIEGGSIVRPIDPRYVHKVVSGISTHGSVAEPHPIPAAQVRQALEMRRPVSNVVRGGDILGDVKVSRIGRPGPAGKRPKNPNNLVFKPAPR
jgi:hypothetical protein